jgi:plasmid maintenance system antidote protein VapI
MSRTANALVAEIKTLYGRRREEKLQIQKDMVALRDEHDWTEQQIADATDISQSTVSRWLVAYDEGLTQVGKASRLTPESVQAASDRRVAQRVLSTAPVELIERMVDTLPKERRQAIEAHFGDGYARARHHFEQRERNLTPAQRKEREAAQQTMSTYAGRALAPIKALSVANELNMATETLKELIADQSLTPEMIVEIERSLGEFQVELEVARAMAGLEVGS